MTKPRNFGLIVEPFQPEDFLGGTTQSLECKFGAAEINPSGDWTPYLPSEEDQRAGNADTFACVSYGTTNAVEMLAKAVFKDTKNLSDRFLAKTSGTILGQGNSPKKVADTLRHTWSVNEPEWPDVDDINTYYADIPEGVRTLAVARGAEFEFGYQYEPNNPANIKQALKRSPVCIAVTAWQEKDGLYTRIKGAQENHWATIVKVNEDGTYLVFDSFAPFLKRVHPSAAQSVAMSYYLNRNIKKESAWQRFIKELKKWIFQAPPGIPEAPKPEPTVPVTPPPAPEPKRLAVYEEAKRWLGRDASEKDLADDELGCAESVSNILRRVYPDFPIILSTISLTAHLKKDKRFKSTLDFKPGNIIISPTGTGVGHGHVGICDEGERIMSNTSKTGKWESNYTLKSWVAYFRTTKGMPVIFYEPL